MYMPTVMELLCHQNPLIMLDSKLFEDAEMNRVNNLPESVQRKIKK